MCNFILFQIRIVEAGTEVIIPHNDSFSTTPNTSIRTSGISSRATSPDAQASSGGMMETQEEELRCLANPNYQQNTERQDWIKIGDFFFALHITKAFIFVNKLEHFFFQSKSVNTKT